MTASPTVLAMAWRVANEMEVEGHQRLLEVLLPVQGQIMLSGYASAMYESALSAWSRCERPSVRVDGSRGQEVFWISPSRSRAEQLDLGVVAGM